MQRFSRLISAFVVFLFILAPAAAYEDFKVDGVTYNPEIPDPETFLDKRLGEWPVRHHELVEYIRTVAFMSDRITVETIGYSHEQRPILFLVVTSPENHARLDEIRANHVALTDPGADQPITEDMPVVTWLNYGVHGYEGSGMDASLPTVYHLAAAQGEEIENQLQNSVILITAIFNPDGHSRRAAWFDENMTRMQVTDPIDRLHNSNWPGGRTNHYWFDLNRQWLLLTQPEPRAWVQKWHEWQPNLSVDYHEMGWNSTYYFHPGIPTRTFPYVPDEAIELMNEYAELPAQFMDEETRLYFSKEQYDNFYIGKGSTYPLVNGAVGVLFEAGTGRGGVVKTETNTRSYRRNIHTHYRTSLASIASGLAMRDKLLSYKKRFYETAMDEAGDQESGAWVFKAPGDPGRLYHFIDVLRRHQINVHRLARSVTVDGEQYTPEDSYIVPLGQRQYVMIRSIFDRFTEFEDESFYDISSWTLPLSFNLDYGAVGSRAFSGNMAGEAVEAVREPAEAPDQASYAYMMHWTPYYSPSALYRILDAGIQVRAATRPVEVQTTNGPRTFERGSLMIPFEFQDLAPADIHDVLAEVSAETGVPVHAVTSGRATGIGDLGGPSFETVRKPNVLLLTGRGTSFYNSGEIWHLLDYRMHIPVTRIERDDLRSVDWADYTHLIIPEGGYSDLDENVTGRIDQWVRDGGTVMGIGSGARWAHQAFLADKGDEDKEGNGAEDATLPERRDYAGKTRDEAVPLIAGAIFRGDLDVTHPLGFGYASRDLPLHKDSRVWFDLTDNPYGTVIQYTDDPLMSGYVSEENQQKVAGKAALVAERHGAGAIILHADNPNFRGIWFGTNKLLMNGLFFSRIFDRPASQ